MKQTIEEDKEPEKSGWIYAFQGEKKENLPLREVLINDIWNLVIVEL